MVWKNTALAVRSENEYLSADVQKQEHWFCSSPPEIEKLMDVMETIIVVRHGVDP